MWYNESIKLETDMFSVTAPFPVTGGDPGCVSASHSTADNCLIPDSYDIFRQKVVSFK